MTEFKLFNDINKLTVWLLPILGKILRNFRYTLSIRIENTLYDITDVIRTYEVIKDNELLKTIDIKMKSISTYIRYANQIKLITEQKHYTFIQQSETIGKQLGGWLDNIHKGINEKNRLLL